MGRNVSPGYLGVAKALRLEESGSQWTEVKRSQPTSLEQGSCWGSQWQNCPSITLLASLIPAHQGFLCKGVWQ